MNAISKIVPVVAVIVLGTTISAVSAHAKSSIAVDMQNGTLTGDTQAVQKGSSATFTIRVMNSGDEEMTEVAINVPGVSDCDRSKEEMKKLYGGTFDPKEVVTYTCSKKDVQSAFSAEATVTAKTKDGKTLVTVCDDTAVTLAKKPEEPQKPEKPQDPEKPKKPEKKKCDASVGDLVWNDRNKNGIQDAGEEGIAGVKITVTKGNKSFSDKTNGSGHYTVDDLCKGEYTVKVVESTLPKGCYQTYDKDGKLDHKTKVHLDNDEHYKNADFGYYCPTKTVAPKTSPRTGVSTSANIIIAAVTAAGMAWSSRRLIRVR